MFLTNGTRIDYSVSGAGLPNSNDYETITDRNGNKIEFSGNPLSAPAQTVIKDGTGRTITITYSTSPGVDTISASGYAQQWTVSWTTHTPSGATYYYSSNPAYPPDTITYGLTDVSSIFLPTGRSYSFTYGGKFGEATTVSLPTGAATTLAYYLDSFGGTPNWNGVFLNAPVSKTVTYNNEYDGGQTSEAWTYSFPTVQGGSATSSMTAPDNGTTQFYFVGLAYTGTPAANAGQIFKIVKADGSVVERNWQQNIPYRAVQDSYIAPSLDPPIGNTTNPWVQEELTSDSNSGLSPVITNSHQSTQDKNGNPASDTWYDYSTYASLHSGGNALYGSSSVGSVLRAVSRTFTLPSPDSSDYTTYSPNEYTESGANLLDLVHTVSTGSLQTITYAYDTTGNVLSESNSGVTRSYGYDSEGNRTSVTDGNGVQTQYTFGAISCPGGSVSGLYPTLQQAAYGTAVEMDTSFSWDCNFGQVLTSTDPNGVFTSNTYDAVGRPATASVSGHQTAYTFDDANRIVTIKRDVATSGDLHNVSIRSYDQLGRLFLTDQQEDPTNPSDITKHIRVQTRYPYSSAGRYQMQTNPYRVPAGGGTNPNASNDDTAGWTVTAYDQAGRVASLKHYTGGATPNTWPSGTNANVNGTVTNLYDADTTSLQRKVTSTDEAGGAKKNGYDALSRLRQVIEDPMGLGYLTCYTYDQLDDLTDVAQGATLSGGQCSSAGQTRHFTYDPLQRLTSAANPESGTVNYTDYDGNGNLLRKVDANSVATSYRYDALNRIGLKHYPAGSPTDSVYCYDGDTATSHGNTPDWSCAGAPSGGSNLKGRLTMVKNGWSVTQYSQYDAWGRVLASQQSAGGVPYSFSYTYDAAGNLLTESYPSGRTLSYAHDAIGRASALSGTYGATFTNYTSATSPITYAAHGAMRQATLGTSNSLIEAWGYNARLQPTSMNLGTTSTNASVRGIGFDYGSPNGGNLMTETISGSGVSGTLSQSYTYDKVNRISTAGEGSAWSRGFGFDSYGNSWVSSANGIAASTFTAQSQTAYGTSGIKNQLLSNGGAYDSGGNQIAMGGYSFTWDAETRIATSVLGGATTAYIYDGEGRRVWKVDCPGTGSCDPTTAGATWTWYVYDAAGQLVAEYGGGATAPCTMCFVAADHLGSTRVMTNSSGTPVECHDYLPFGEEIGAGVNGRNGCYSGAVDKGVLFTGQYRDGETQSSAMPSGLDFFGARYMSGAQGRFTSPDTSGLLTVKPTNPQSWNMYAYTMNNPLVNIDPTGLDCVNATDSNGGYSVNHDTNSGACGTAGGTWVPGYVDENWVHFNQNTSMYQVGSIDGAGNSATVDYANFAAGAQTDANGSCTSGCGGYGFASANANWLQGQLVGSSRSGGLDGYIQFLTGREEPLGGGLLNRLVSGPLDPSTDHWAGPGGMGPPGGQGDWAASVHDYNFSTNGPSAGQGISIGMYFNPTLSPATSRALIQSNSNLIRNAGGVQAVKMGMFFGVVNAFQWYANSWK